MKSYPMPTERLTYIDDQGRRRPVLLAEQVEQDQMQVPIPAGGRWLDEQCPKCRGQCFAFMGARICSHKGCLHVQRGQEAH